MVLFAYIAQKNLYSSFCSSSYIHYKKSQRKGYRNLAQCMCPIMIPLYLTIRKFGLRDKHTILINCSQKAVKIEIFDKGKNLNPFKEEKKNTKENRKQKNKYQLYAQTPALS